MMTWADDCIGRKIVDKIYNDFEIPTEYRFRARLSQVYQREIGKVAAFLHMEHFSDIDRKVSGCIYAANKMIHERVTEWTKKQHCSVAIQELSPLDNANLTIEVEPIEDELFEMIPDELWFSPSPEDMLPIHPN